MSLIGYQIAPAFTSNILASASALKGLQAASTLVAGFAKGGLLGVAAGSAALATWLKGFELVKAKMKEIQSEEGLKDQFETLKPKRIGQIKELESRGRITPFDSTGLINLFNTANSPDQRANALKRSQALLMENLKKDLHLAGVRDFSNFTAPLNIQAIANPMERAMAEINAKFDQIKDDIINKSSVLKPPREIIDQALKSIEATRARELMDSNESFKSKSEAPAFEALQKRPVTAIEKIGFAFTGGMRGGKDPAEGTFQNTRTIAQTLSKHTEILSRIADKPTADFSNT